MPPLRQQYPIRHMALFGSVARGNAGPESEIGILVGVDPSIGLVLWRWQTDLRRSWAKGGPGVPTRSETSHVDGHSTGADRCRGVMPACPWDFVTSLIKA